MGQKQNRGRAFEGDAGISGILNLLSSHFDYNMRVRYRRWQKSGDYWYLQCLPKEGKLTFYQHIGPAKGQAVFMK
ncbi:MAG: hypothetical protein EZS28_003994 [Streblomastix strix]|uniref:Uncharacterized protein n=1 Tax=Streblomastix strix TaxID=222440 RepID=A0A5J4WZC8_9EUKA|nr:MAG: hypothetical protein EZS28_003994 [Streblomastix strix]